MGADEAYLLSAREFGGSDTYATATIIATALKKIGYDLVITGRQAIDGDTAQVGPQIAEQLHVQMCIRDRTKGSRRVIPPALGFIRAFAGRSWGFPSRPGTWPRCGGRR